MICLEQQLKELSYRTLGLSPIGNFNSFYNVEAFIPMASTSIQVTYIFILQPKMLDILLMETVSEASL